MLLSDFEHHHEDRAAHQVCLGSLGRGDRHLVGIGDECLGQVLQLRLPDAARFSVKNQGRFLFKTRGRSPAGGSVSDLFHFVTRLFFAWFALFRGLTWRLAL
jgi:hypothetical protein